MYEPEQVDNPMYEPDADADAPRATAVEPPPTQRHRPRRPAVGADEERRAPASLSPSRPSISPRKTAGPPGGVVRRSSSSTGQPPPKMPEYAPMVRARPYVWRAPAAGYDGSSGRSASRVYAGVCTEAARVAEKLNLAGWLRRRRGQRGGVRGVVLVLGNSDQLDGVLEGAHPHFGDDGGGGTPRRSRPANVDDDGGDDDDDDAGRREWGSLPPGLTAAEARSRLQLMFSRGVARAAASIRVAVLTSGTDRGAVSFMGRAARERGHDLPLVGVLAARATAPFGAVKVDGSLAANGLPTAQPDHTHYVLLDTAEEMSAVAYRFELARAIVGKERNRNDRGGGPTDGARSGWKERHAGGGESEALPAVALLVSGSETAMDEALWCVRLGWPLVVVEGTGGAADAIAWATSRENQQHFVPNPKLMEIAREGNVETVRLADADGKILHAMLERLFNGMERSAAWKKRAGGGGKNLRVVGRIGSGVGSFLAAAAEAAATASTKAITRSISKNAPGNGKRSREGTEDRFPRNAAANKRAKAAMVSCCVDLGSRGVERLAEKGSKGSGFPGESWDGAGKDRPGKTISPHATPTAVMAWEEVAVLRANHASLALKHAVMMRIILAAGVLLTLLVTLRADQAHLIPPRSAQGIDRCLYVLPIVISVLVAISGWFQWGTRARTLKAAVTAYECHIYEYRARVNAFAGADVEAALQEGMAEIAERLAASEAGYSSLDTSTPLAAIRSIAYRASARDDGFEVLSPEKFIELRLLETLRRYQDECAHADWWSRTLSIAITALGGLGVFLGAFRLELYIAVAVSCASALAAVEVAANYDGRVVALNRAGTELRDIHAWWEARTPIERANPQKYARLVRDVNAAIRGFERATNPAAAAMLQPLHTVEASFDIHNLVTDIAENVTNGEVEFRSWCDKYPDFFTAYERWWCEVNNYERIERAGPVTESYTAFRRSVPLSLDRRPSAPGDGGGGVSLRALFSSSPRSPRMLRAAYPYPTAAQSRRPGSRRGAREDEGEDVELTARGLTSDEEDPELGLARPLSAPEERAGRRPFRVGRPGPVAESFSAERADRSPAEEALSVAPSQASSAAGFTSGSRPGLQETAQARHANGAGASFGFDGRAPVRVLPMVDDGWFRKVPSAPWGIRARFLGGIAGDDTDGELGIDVSRGIDKKRKKKEMKMKKQSAGGSRRRRRKIHPGAGDASDSDEEDVDQGLVTRIGEILWNPDDFRRRRTRVVQVSGEATSGSASGSASASARFAAGSKRGGRGGGLADVVSALQLDEHLSRIHGPFTVPCGVINVIGASNMLDRFLAGTAEDEMGKLPDGISPEEAITRLMMVFSRGICAAASASDIPAVVVSGGFDVGPSVRTSRVSLIMPRCIALADAVPGRGNTPVAFSPDARDATRITRGCPPRSSRSAGDAARAY